MAKFYPKSQIYWLSIYHNICRIIVKDCWNIFSGKCICGVTDEQTSFTDGSEMFQGKEFSDELSFYASHIQNIHSILSHMIHYVIELN